ncbi:hypothetical protein [Salinimicrobium sp. TH3]|uniref:hypothetical protein n=1 Tax=Salinimicrobium sp. TH3 TaxID=2997342 RepID=UPI0022754D74|nr:hypothetical protein [Salinimicrobium sp. TH3]MCY2685955.1 hypothetical protein [Salinimicrobium sp. TH3]
MNRIDSLYRNLKSRSILQVFTIYLRYLIGCSFIIAAIGMGKFSGIPWNGDIQLDQLHAIQQFFRVISQSVLYWQFIGWTQIIAGVLLVTQRFSKAGALMFFGIILNIFMITVSYNFKGTPVVTGLMLLAVLYLVLWDMDSLKYIFVNPEENNLPGPVNSEIIKSPFWTYLGLFLIMLTVTGMLLEYKMFLVMFAALVAGVAGLIMYFLIRTGKSKIDMRNVRNDRE